jgi:hypothetical protein
LNQTAVAPQIIQTGNLGWPTIAICLTMLGITLGGFAAIIEGALALGRTAGLGREPAMAIVVLGLFTIMLSDFMLMRILSRLIKTSLQPVQSVQPKQLAANATAQRQIPTRPADYVPAVTEHTTRTLEPSYKEK